MNQDEQTATPPATPSDAAMRAAEEIVDLVYGPWGGDNHRANVAAIITRNLAGTPNPDVEAFWTMLDRCWEIEPRSYFEEEALKNGFGSPLAMAVHYMWKREAKPAEHQRRAE